MPNMKRCSVCGDVKQLHDFNNDASTKDGRSYKCRECDRRRKAEHRRRKGIKPRGELHAKLRRFHRSLLASKHKAKRFGYAHCTATVEEIKQAFTGNCDICGVPESECTQKLHMDHCHESGLFRGWICFHCNNMLGRAKDNPDILRMAAMYLEENSLWQSRV